MRCDELIEDKVAVLYGEADAAAQQRVGEHSRSCEACRDELREMRGVRRTLAAWKLPAGLRPRRPWRRPALLPSWALPAAAALVIGVGAFALARAETRYAGLARQLSLQEERHALELVSLRGELRAARAAQTPVADGAPELLARVSALIERSEDRQRMALRAGLEAVESRRQYDMARIKTGFSYLEGRNGQDMANAMKLVSYVLASQPGGDAAAGPR